MTTEVQLGVSKRNGVAVTEVITHWLQFVVVVAVE